jgi:hypothetical protein
MSCYQWESGSLKVPSAEWASLKKRFIEAWNAEVAKRFAVAEELHAHLIATGKGKRKLDYVKAAREWADQQRGSRTMFSATSVHRDRAYAVICRVVPYKEGAPRKPKKPLKKDFPFARSNTLVFSDHSVMDWDGNLSFKNETRTLEWEVRENNRAVDNAWDHPMGLALGDALSKVTWTRASGGKFIGNDEYNRHSDYEGGGANYVTRRYGPLGEISHRSRRYSRRY